MIYDSLIFTIGFLQIKFVAIDANLGQLLTIQKFSLNTGNNSIKSNIRTDFHLTQAVDSIDYSINSIESAVSFRFDRIIVNMR